MHRILDYLMMSIVLMDIGLALGLLLTGGNSRLYEFLDLWRPIYLGLYTIACFGLAWVYMAEGKPMVAGFFLFFGIFTVYVWWNNDSNRRRRKKLRDRMAAVVKNIGGRLKVVRPVTN